MKEMCKGCARRNPSQVTLFDIEPCPYAEHVRPVDCSHYLAERWWGTPEQTVREYDRETDSFKEIDY